MLNKQVLKYLALGTRISDFSHRTRRAARSHTAISVSEHTVTDAEHTVTDAEHTVTDAEHTVTEQGRECCALDVGGPLPASLLPGVCVCVCVCV